MTVELASEDSMKRRLMGLSDEDELTEAQMLGIYGEGAYTMIGYKRLCNIEELICDIAIDDVKGDVIETGVWRGGAVIYMKFLLDALWSRKKVFVADSFKGLPPPDPAYPRDKIEFNTFSFLSVSQEQVQENFAKFGLLDDNVVFVKGWFKDTLPKLPGPFALIRLDGDMYESTINALDALYPKLTPGGYCIIDDWFLPAAQAAATDYRVAHEIDSPVMQIDGFGVYWRKE
jgi:hypothetical protein